MERSDYLEEETPIPDDWQIDGDPIYVADDDEDHLERIIREWVYTLRHVGGVVAVTADKHEIAPGVWRNRGFAVKWNSYAPGERLPKPEGENGGRRRRRRDPEPQQTLPPEADPPADDDDEESEPDGGRVVDRLDPDEVDPDNAGIKDDFRNDPADVFAERA